MQQLYETFGLHRVHKAPFLLAFLLCAVITAGLSAIDIWTGSEYSISIFYLIPITIAVFINGRSLGILFSFICAMTWIFSDLSSGTSYSSVSAIIWNTFVRLLYFLLHTIVLSWLLELVRLHREYSYIDPLTKAANWRYFEVFSNERMKIAAQNQVCISLTYLDIDDFKCINDAYGHATGDLVLVMVADIIRRDLRKNDLLARLGGDEFAILLHDADFKRSLEIMNRINQSVLDEMRKRDWHVTLSIGCIVFRTFSSDLGAMLRQADELMYEAKRNGKNTIRIADQSAKDTLKSPALD